MLVFRLYALLWLLTVASTAHAVDAGSMEIRIVPAITDNYILDDYRPAVADQSATIRMVAAPNEYEPASFVVFANETIDDLQLTTTSLVGSDGVSLSGAVLDIRIVKRWYQRNFGADSDPADPRLRFLIPELLIYDDALIKVEGNDNYLRLQSGEYINISKPGNRRGFLSPKPANFSVRDASVLQPLTIVKDSNRQFWVTLYLPPNAEAGNYRAEIELLQGERVVEVIPVLVEVLPFQLDEPQIHYSIFYRGKLDKDWPEGSISSEYKSEEQMLSDFQNLAAHGISNPLIYQRYATGLLDKVLSLREQAGMDNPRIYYLGAPEVSGDDGQVSPRLAGTVKGVLDTAGEYGIEDVYFFARDEAKGELLRKQFPYWDAVKKAGGKIMAAGWQKGTKNAGNFSITGGREDLFVSLGVLRYQEARNWHSKDRLIYSYQNPTGGWEIPETWRRNYGLLLWQYEYDGGMPYAWQHSYRHVWKDFDDAKYKDHNFTYPTVDGQIDTVQWEGLREGVDDVRYLRTLINVLPEIKGDGSSQEAEARAWLSDLKDRPLGQSDLSMIRAEMVAYILALKGLAPVDMTDAIDEVQILPIELGGVATVTWETAERTPGHLQINKGDESYTASSRGLTLHHELSVPGLKPNEKYSFIAYSNVDADGLPIQHEGIIDTSTAIKLTPAAIESNEVLLLDVDLKSNYRSSIGVDWQRSLLGWWRFSSVKSPGADDSTWDNDAKLKGNAQSSIGLFGNGVSLDGDGAFLSMPDINVAENGSATIEGWFKFRSFAMDNLVSMGLFSGLYQHGSNNHFYFARTNEYFLVGSLLQLDTWHHIALIRDGDTTNAAIYIDGQRVRVTVLGEVEELPSIDGLTIGRHVGYFGGLVSAASNTFDGDVDEIRVWNRVLSDAEIQASYNAGRSDLRFTFPAAADGMPDFSLIGANAADQMVVEPIKAGSAGL